MQDRTITLIDENGKEKKAQILFTYHNDELNRNYVVFVDTETNQASAAEYFEEKSGEGHLGDIQTEEEWNMLQDVFEDYMNKEGESDGCKGCCGGCGSDGCGSEGCGSNCSCGDKKDN